MSIQSRSFITSIILVMAFSSTPLLAQTDKLGAYAGTVKVSYGTQSKLESMSAKGEVKLQFPVTQRTASAVEAEMFDPSTVKASMLVTHYETFQKAASPDSGGQINTVSCKLDKPTEVAMDAQGVFSLDLKARTHTFSVALVLRRSLPMTCVHSRSGASKSTKGLVLGIGTHEPGPPPPKGVPFTDAASPSAKYTMPVGPAMKSQGTLPVEQEWAFRFQP
jgi:hypothetical protein